MKCHFATACLLLSACSVTKQVVRNLPPQVENYVTQTKSSYGAIEQFNQLSMFFWPVTAQSGRALSIAERTDVVAKVLVLATEADRLTDKQNNARAQACDARDVMKAQGCAQFSKSNPDSDGGDEPCSTPWISEWRTIDDFKDNKNLQAQLLSCQAVVARGQAGESLQQKLARDKDEKTAQIVQTIDTQDGQSNFFIGIGANSKLTLEAESVRIKLAFSQPDIIYDSNPDDERGLIENVHYDASVGKLVFTMREKVGGIETGGQFRVTASRVPHADPQFVRFSGQIGYERPGQMPREGRIKFEGRF